MQEKQVRRSGNGGGGGLGGEELGEEGGPEAVGGEVVHADELAGAFDEIAAGAGDVGLDGGGEGAVGAVQGGGGAGIDAEDAGAGDGGEVEGARVV